MVPTNRRRVELEPQINLVEDINRGEDLSRAVVRVLSGNSGCQY